MSTIYAPFTPEQVLGLNAYQANGMVHPFTCGNSSLHQNLVATEAGWKCPDCDYAQNWAWGFMAEPLSGPDEPSLEDKIEAAFWAFDAERKTTGAERDAFKSQVRKLAADLGQQ